jgi:23S rRNA (cytidine1920-2'-O)/16S rRNA (cytidine1409-2'-O)-methyltransferase
MTMADKPSKIRLDIFLTDEGYFPSRKMAQAAIMAGRVYIDGVKKEKAGERIHPDARIEITEPMPYVSRGALKLEGALKDFDIDPSGYICLDIGASTGGFTDYLLQRGSERVYALDVAYGQMATKIRNDERVVVMERFNARYLSKEDIPDKLDLIVMDVSFISIRLILVNLPLLLKPGGRVVSLIKPQFEVGRGQVGSGGIVRKAEPVREALNKLKALDEIHELYLNDLTLSPIEGTRGNKELFGLFELTDAGFRGSEFDAKAGELLDIAGFE